MRVVIATLLLTISLAGCGKSEPSAEAFADTAKPAASQPGVAAIAVDRSHAGEAAPLIVFEARGGFPRRITNFGGKYALVNLWATWCAPCIAELPALNTLAIARSDVLVVVPVSQDIEGWQVVDKRFKPGAYTQLEPYLDQKNELALAFGAKGLPMSILYDAQSREVWRVTRPLEWNSREVRALLP